MPWLNRESPLSQAMITQLYAGFIDRFGDQIAPEHRIVCERLVAAFDGYLAQEADGSAPGGFTVWSTVTTGWTTCCSVPMKPTAR